MQQHRVSVACARAWDACRLAARRQRPSRCVARCCRPALSPRFPRCPLTAPQAVRGNVNDVITEKDQRGQRAQLLKDLDLEQVRLVWGPRAPGLGLQC